MSKATQVRQLALKVAYGGGGLGLIGAAVAAVLISQAELVRRAIPRDVLIPPESSGKYGGTYSGKPLHMALLGDSSAAGLGAEFGYETPGALIAEGLAAALKRPVDLSCVAVSGAQSQHLHSQVDEVMGGKPDIIVIFIGANDVIKRVRTRVAVRHLDLAVRRLRTTGAPIVVATCPDMSTIEPVRPPLRWLVRRWCREMAAAQTIAVVTAGGRTVSLGEILADAFEQSPRELFSVDRFHPSAHGYRMVAEVVLPSILAALGHAPELAGAPQGLWKQASLPRQGVRSLEHAAAEAASTAGTEVAPLPESEREGGLWGDLRNRLAWLTDWVPTNLVADLLPNRSQNSETLTKAT